MSAAAIADGHAGIARFDSAYGAFVAAKNSALATTAAESNTEVQEQLERAVKEYGNLHKAVDALAIDQNLSDCFSRDRLKELQRLLALSADRVVEELSEQRELIFHVERFVEGWCNANSISVERITASVDLQLSTISHKLNEAIELSRQNSRANQDAFERLTLSLDAVARVSTADKSPEEARATLGISASLLEIQNRLLDFSQTILRWPATIGKSRSRLTAPAVLEVLARMDADRSTTLVVGSKGAGKSALAAEVGTEAVRRGFVVIGIRG